MKEDSRPFEKMHKIKNLFIWLVPLAFIDLMTKQYFFDLTLPIVIEIRNNYATKNLDLFFEIVSQIGDKIGFIIAAVCGYHFLDLEKAFTVALCNYSAIALLSFLKCVNHEARPFHVWDIQPSKCTFEYGNPSGHSLWSTAVFLTFWDLNCRQYNWRKGSIKYRISFIFIVVVILLISFSRIWHAVHTINQLSGGWIWGYGLYYLYSKILYVEL